VLERAGSPLLVAALGSALATALAVPLQSLGLFLVGSSAIIVVVALSLWRLISRGRGAQGPTVGVVALLPLAVFGLLVLAIAYVDEELRHRPAPDSVGAQVFLAVFGQRRYFLTWPLVAGAVFGPTTLVLRIARRRRSSPPRPLP
jgi:hypothetical protein